MEPRNPGSSKENGGLFTGLLQMYGRSSQTAGHGCFSSPVPGSGPPQTHSACHKAESNKTAYLSDLTPYMDSFTAEDSSNPVFAFDAPSRAPPRVPSEALLDAISVAQRRLQHLELFVRMMIQARGQPHQHHSLAMEFVSIMSQLSAATADLTSPPPFQASPLLAPLANDAFDFGFDAFSEEDLSRTLGEGSALSGPSASGMDGMLSGACQGLGLCLPSWAMDVRAIPATEPTASPDEVANIFTTVHVQGNMDESTVENGAQPDPHGKANCALLSDNQTLLSHEEQREEEEDGEDERLPPGSYELMELAATEILAEHTHFCEICGKGFKRDANLRMHMRGHGDEYKTAAALARPDKLPRDCSVMKLRRYSCPYTGCKRNKKHPKFQPLKTMLCVKNHYRRSHCPKVLVCSRCKTKKFSVNADLKTHEKHCGQDKWQCSCGTTFSRKDKLYGHIGLFAGHTPAILAHEAERTENLGSKLKVLASSSSNAPQIPVNVKEDNVDTGDVDGSQGLGVTVVRTRESDKGSIREQSLNERKKTAMTCVSKVALSNEPPFHLSASSTTGPDSSDVNNVMSDGVDRKAKAAD